MTTLAPRYSNLNGAPQGVLSPNVELSTVISAIGSLSSELLINVPVSVTSNTTIPATLETIVQKGALISIATGVTLTINGPFNAGVYQVFSITGTGKVVFNNAVNSTGYPEWWGAQVNNSSFDCSTAINACIVALPQTQLQAGNYYVGTRIVMQVQGRSLLGTGYGYAGNPGSSSVAASRIVINNGLTNGILIGYDTNPGTGSNDYEAYLFGCTIKNIALTRSVAPVAPGTFTAPTLPMPTNLPVGIQITYAAATELVNVDVWDSIVGIYVCATTGVRLTQTRSNRATAASSGSDYFNAFFLDGYATSYSTAGQNASTYLTDCSAQCRVEALSSTNKSQAYVLNQAFNDVFLLRPEAINFYTGIYVYGSEGTVKSKSDVDLHIIGAIVDVYRGQGIYFNNVSDYGAISVMDGYFAPLAGMTGSDYPGIQVINSTGCISFVNNQVIGYQTLTSIGVIANTSSGLLFKNNMYVGCSKKTVVTSVKNCRFEDIVSNPNEGEVSVITLVTSSRNYIAPTLKAGGGNLFTVGVEMVGTGCTYNEVNCSGLDPTSITGGSSNKLLYNSTQVTTTGIFGTNNLASGIMN